MTRRFLLAVTITAGIAGTVAAQPRVIEIKGGTIPPGQVEEIAKRLKEDVELMEAQRDIKREYVKAAEVQLDVAKRKLALVERAGNQVSAQEKADALAAVDLGSAQLRVRNAELKEADLRVTHAKRRVDSGVFPLVLTPVPAPSSFPAPKKPAEELGELTAKVEAKRAKAEGAKAAVALAKADYDRTKQLIEKGVAPMADLDKSAAALQRAEANFKLAAAEVAEAEAALKAAQPTPQIIYPPKNPQPQSKLPARNGFPSPQSDFSLAQVEYEVANLRFEIAQVEMQQLQKLGITGEQMDAAKARYEDAKTDLHAAEDKVLKAQKKIDPFGK